MKKRILSAFLISLVLTITYSPIVLAQEPTNTPTPTPTSTPTLTPTPTTQAVTPATDGGIPEAGYFTPTLFLLIAGVVLLTLSLVFVPI